MIYEALGNLLGQAGEAVGEAMLEEQGDARQSREVRQIATLLRRTSGVWSGVFSALGEESAILAEAVSEANETLDANGLEPIRVGSEEAPSVGSIEHYRALAWAADKILETLLMSQDPWRLDARKRLRDRLAAAAEIQGRLTEAMLAIR